MLFVDNQQITDPRINLAIEEHLLRNLAQPDPLLLFYINEPAVIIGRNQNTVAEIDPEFIAQQQIHVVRRLSGGGAVYHDLGNLNFSFITNGRDHLHQFDQFLRPVVAALQKMGLNAQIRGKSDIFVADKKVSGNAQFASNGRMFSHGTLLFNSNLQNLLNALNPSQQHISSQAVQSIRNFVTNLSDHLPQPLTIQQLQTVLLQELFGQQPAPEYTLGPDDWQQIEQISASRYQTWEWNYGRSPRFNIQKQAQFPQVGKIELRLEVEKGHISQLKFYGDFAGSADIADLEARLIGQPYNQQTLTNTLKSIEISPYFGNLSKPDLLQLILG